MKRTSSIIFHQSVIILISWALLVFVPIAWAEENSGDTEFIGSKTLPFTTIKEQESRREKFAFLHNLLAWNTVTNRSSTSDQIAVAIKQAEYANKLADNKDSDIPVSYTHLTLPTKA